MKKLLLLLSIFLSTLYTEAQRAGSYFIVMPEELLPQLNTSLRKDMIDYFKSGKDNPVTNLLGGESKITDLNDNFIAVNLSDKSSLQMRLLSVNDSLTIIAIINTICAPACDSRIEFYDTNWKQLKTSDYILAPSKIEFADTIGNSPEKIQEAIEWIDMPLMVYSFNPEDSNISISLTIKDYLPEEIYIQIEPALQKKPLIRYWNGIGYQQQNTDPS